MKHCSSDELVAAVSRVAAGRIYCSQVPGEEFATGFRQYDSRLKPYEVLGRREFEVFAMVVCGPAAAGAPRRHGRVCEGPGPVGRVPDDFQQPVAQPLWDGLAGRVKRRLSRARRCA